MFSLNLSEIITFRKCYLLTVWGFVGFSVCLWLFILLLLFFSPSLLQHSFQSHDRITERSCTFDIHWVNTRFPTFTLEQTSLRKTVLTVSLIMNSLSKRNYWIYPCMDISLFLLLWIEASSFLQITALLEDFLFLQLLQLRKQAFSLRTSKTFTSLLTPKHTQNNVLFSKAHQYVMNVNWKSKLGETLLKSYRKCYSKLHMHKSFAKLKVI